MSRRLFTPEEDARIAELRSQNLSWSEIGRQLGRPAKSVETRNRRANKPKQKGGRRFRYWTTDEDAIIRANMSLTYTEIGKLLPDRSIDSISYRFGILFPRAEHARAINLANNVPIIADSRPYGIPFRTASGLAAIRLANGVVPYLPTIHGDMEFAS